MKLTVTLTALAVAGSAAFTQGPDLIENPVIWMVVEHEVADFDHWLGTFEAALTTRRGAGELSHRIDRDAADPNRLTVIMKWVSGARARSFVQDPVLAIGMRTAGVVDGARIWICDTATAPTAAGTSPDCDLVGLPSLAIGIYDATHTR